MTANIGNRTTVNTKLDALSKQELQAIDAYWRAANYLSVGQIYYKQYTAQYGEDMIEVSGWTWGQHGTPSGRRTSTEADNTTDQKVPAA
jgi:hypothetical protein